MMLNGEGPRTQGQRLHQFMTEESDESSRLKGAAAFVSTGLCLEAEKYVVQLTDIFNDFRSFIHLEGDFWI
jgi:hypothetical protein